MDRAFAVEPVSRCKTLPAGTVTSPSDANNGRRIGFDEVVPIAVCGFAFGTCSWTSPGPPLPPLDHGVLSV